MRGGNKMERDERETEMRGMETWEGEEGGVGRDGYRWSGKM